MTIAVIWQEDGLQWCAADTRLVAGSEDTTIADIATKMFSIPVEIRAFGSEFEPRDPHYWTKYGFVFAGSALPASMTAITASTLLQKLGRKGGRTNPPTFEEIAELVHRLAKRFMVDRRRFSSDGIFSAAFFGWCPHAEKYKIAHIDGRIDAGSFRVDLSYPLPPQTDGDPWLVLGSAAPTFKSTLDVYLQTEGHAKKGIPRRVIDKMVAEEQDRTVGGATSIGAAHQYGFELFYASESVELGEPTERRIFNGLDLDTEIGQVGQYVVLALGHA